MTGIGTNEPFWANIRQREFAGQPLNLNPGTLGTIAQSVRHTMRQFNDAEGGAVPLGQYQRRREAVARCQSVASDLWPTQTHSCIVSTPSTQTMAVLTFALREVVEANNRRPVRVLTTQHEHYGGVAGFEQHPGYAVSYLPCDGCSLPAFHDALEQTRPQIVLLSHVLYDRCAELPMQRMAALCRDIYPQALIIIDAAQSLGLRALPIDCADIVVASTHKWLHGPRGLGYI